MISIFLLFSFVEAEAFTTMYKDMKGWATDTLEFRPNYSECGSVSASDLDSAIDDAIAAWNSVSTSKLKLSRGLPTTETGSLTSSPPIIQCDSTNAVIDAAEEDFVPGAGVPVKYGDTLAAGFLVLNKTGGKADISNLTQTTLRIVLAHEIGHILGLGHSELKAALLYFNISEKAYLRLAQDDWDGISFLYPRNELGGDGLFGCGTVQTGKIKFIDGFGAHAQDSAAGKNERGFDVQQKRALQFFGALGFYFMLSFFVIKLFAVLEKRSMYGQR